MKKVLFIAVMMIASFAYAQETAVPKEVETAFHQKFPDGKDAKWEHKGNDFIVSFSHNHGVETAAFDEHGSWKYSKANIEVSKIPANVSASVNEKFHDSTIEKAYEVKTEKGTFYKFFVKTAEKETHVVKVDTEGTILKSEKYDGTSKANHSIN